MKKSALIVLSLAILASITFAISSCKEDEPPAKPVVSFDDETQVAQEGAGIVNIVVELDKPAPNDITVEYTLAGTAVDLELAPNVAASDYSIVGGTGELEIEKGESSGVIQIDLRSDASYEGDETIELELDDAGAEATISDEKSTMVFTIKDDDPKPAITFASSSITVNEDDGVIEIPVTLDAVVAENLTIQFTLGGDAVDSITSKASEETNQYIPADYAIRGTTPGSITIKKNSSSGVIRVGIYTDFYFEGDEPFTITLNEASGVDIGTNGTITVNIQQQDGLVAELHWDEAYTDVDMDMFLWLNDGTDRGIVALSAYSSFDAPEQIFIPAIINDAFSFEMTYVYYAGTASPMNFSVIFAEVIDGVLESSANFQEFAGAYTTANINAWETLSDVTLTEQTFDKEGGVFTNFSQITVPASSSRVSNTPTTIKLNRAVKKGTRSLVERTLKN
jgi:hypothetical protein